MEINNVYINKNRVTTLVSPKDRPFYVIYRIKDDDNGHKSPSYAMFIDDGIMLQGNIYDATKFRNRDQAFDYLAKAEEQFEDYSFYLMELPQVMFGNMPRQVIQNDRF